MNLTTIAVDLAKDVFQNRPHLFIYLFKKSRGLRASLSVTLFTVWV